MLHTQMELAWQSALLGETEGGIGVNAVGKTELGKSACFGASETAHFVDVGLRPSQLRVGNIRMIGSLGMRIQVPSDNKGAISRVLGYFPGNNLSPEQVATVQDVHYLEGDERGARHGLPEDAINWFSWLRAQNIGQLEIRLRKPEDTPLAVAAEGEPVLMGPHSHSWQSADDDFTREAVGAFLRRV